MGEENQNQNQSGNEGGISEDELRSMFRTQVKEELDERGLTKDVLSKLNLLDGLEGLFEKHKGDPDSLLGKIGEMIDAKIKTGSTGGGNGGSGKPARQPKLRVFG